MSAIRILTKEAVGDFDEGASKFLGSPVLPEGLAEKLPSTVLFLMQINLADIKDLDEENILPHEGYLYFFLDTAEGPYDLKPIVKYYKGEPTDLYTNFNEVVDGYEECVTPFLITFEKCDDEEGGHKLLGVPGEWQFAEEAENRLLFQFDPMEQPGLDLFPTFDGYMYFFFGKDLKKFNQVTLVEDFS